MQFAPGYVVKLYREDGKIVQARTFHFTDTFGGKLKVELYEDALGGRLLKVIDPTTESFALKKRPLSFFSSRRIQISKSVNGGTPSAGRSYLRDRRSCDSRPARMFHSSWKTADTWRHAHSSPG
jgi:hypothetical protein